MVHDGAAVYVNMFSQLYSLLTLMRRLLSNEIRLLTNNNCSTILPYNPCLIQKRMSAGEIKKARSFLFVQERPGFCLGIRNVSIPFATALRQSFGFPVLSVEEQIQHHT
jgi:hypothetical protein